MEYYKRMDKNGTFKLGYYDLVVNNSSENVTGNDSSEDYYSYSEYGDYDYTIFFYERFDFEQLIYVYIWEILVILTTVFNIVVIIVFMRKRMRSATSAILVAIAISDSLTGLVTLPSYIHVYAKYEPGGQGMKDAYVLEMDWCNAFMISKFFLSKWFHTVSIWLTLFLALQRFTSVLFPLKTKILFTNNRTLCCVALIFTISPVLHIYHLVHQKADENNMCQWALDDTWALVYLWATLLLMHLIPCILLAILSGLMIRSLFSNATRILATAEVDPRSVERRNDWNRRMSIIVSILVVVFLIPEVPYGIFQLYTVLRKHTGKKIMGLHTNRACHAAYEILLVFSYHANFWIYFILNRRFRSELKKTASDLLNRIRMVFGNPARSMSMSTVSGEKMNAQPNGSQMNIDNISANQRNGLNETKS